MVSEAQIENKFKETEVGLIPNDWKIESLLNLSEKIMVGIASAATHAYRNKGVVLLRNQNIKNGFLDDTDILYISEQYESTFSKKRLKEGDLITARTGYPGATCLIPKKYSGAQSFTTLITRPRNNYIIPQYLNHYINSEQGQIFFNSNQIGGSQQNVNAGTLKNMPIVFPPTKEEQTAIATALNDTDKLITQLEKLIAKKQLIKQGAFDSLFKPKENWTTKTLGEVAQYRRGSFPQPYGLDKWYDENNGLPFVQVFDVDDNMKLKSETKSHISKEAENWSVFVEKGTIVLTIQGSIGRIAITQYDAYVDRTLLIFQRFLEPFDKYFFMLTVHRLFEIEKQKAPGGTIKTITKEALSSFQISFPDLNEQKQISKILSEMDYEIEMLEIKLEKLRQLKQGMMQNLLTGKIRLV